MCWAWGKAPVVGKDLRAMCIGPGVLMIETSEDGTCVLGLGANTCYVRCESVLGLVTRALGLRGSTC